MSQDPLFGAPDLLDLELRPIGLHAAIRWLSARCDGAHEHDSVGFSAADTRFGKNLAALPDDEWTPEMLIEAFELATGRYRAQLAQGGWDVSRLARPAGEIVAEDVLSGQWGASTTTKGRVQAKKAARAVREAIDGSAAPLPASRVESAGDRWAVTFPYDPSMVKAVKSVSGATWDTKQRRWLVPRTPHGARALLAFATTWDLAVLVDDVEPMAEASEALHEASRADTAEFDVAGLRGELYAFQRAGVAYAVATRRCFIADEMGLGKGGTIDSKILTPKGWTTYGQVAVGDEVIGSDGRATTVTGVFPRGRLPVYAVTFNDGASVVVDGDHLWSVQHVRNGWRHPDRWKAVSTRSLLNDGLRDGAGNLTWRIPMVRSVQFEGGPLPLDPYVYGVLLGDGSVSSAVVYTCGDDLVPAEVAKVLPDSVNHVLRGNGVTWGITGTHPVAGGNPILNACREVGLAGKRSWEKTVDERYLFASAGERLSLLQGLLDTDGEARPDGLVQFCSSSEDLTDAVSFLVQSLGGVARRSYKAEPKYQGGVGRPAYLATLALPSGVNPFRAWAGRYRPRTKYFPTRIIRSVEAAGEAEVICIAVDAADHLYVTEHCVVTHNTPQSIAAVHETRSYPTLMVTPLKARTNWALECAKWLPVDKTVAIVVSPSTPEWERRAIAARGFTPMVGQPKPGADVYIAAYDLLHTMVDSFEPIGLRALVLDESQLVKTRTQQKVCPTCRSPLKKPKGRPVAACPKGHTVKPVTVYKVLRVDAAWRLSRQIPADGMVLCLSGTPNKNLTEDFVAQLDILGRLDEFGGAWAFLRRFCGAWRDSFGWHTDGATNLAELNTRLRASCYVRRLKSQVLPDLPPISRPRLTVEVPAEAMAVYQAAEDDVVSFLAARAAELAAEAGEDERAASWEQRLKAQAAEHLVKVTTLKRLAAAAKIEAAVEWVQTFLDETDRKVVVFAHHLEVVARLAEQFGADRIDGTVGDPTPAVERFQAADGPRVLVVGIMAGGVALTLTAASDMLFVEQVWTPADHDQAESRCFGRVNDPHGATATYMLAAGTIDEDVWEMIETKREVFHAAADGEGANSVAKVSVLGEILVNLAKRAQR